MHAFTLSLSLLSAPAYAEEPSTRPVLRIDGPYVYAAIGAASGLRPGDSVELLRVVEVVDPQSRRTLTDTFAAGSVRVVEVGQTLSILQGTPAVIDALVVGDLVRFTPRAPAPPGPAVARTPAPGVILLPVEPAPSVVPSLPAPAPEPESDGFRETFAAMTGLDRVGRIAVWESWRNANPNHPLDAAIASEIEALTQAALPAAPNLAPLVVTPVGPIEARRGEPVRVAVTVSDPARVGSIRLLYRHPGDAGDLSIPMTPYGDAAFTGVIPGEEAQPEGLVWRVAYEDTVPVRGEVVVQTTRPRAVDVRVEPDDVYKKDRSEVRFSVEYVDLYKLKGADRYWHFETDFLYRLNTPLHSMRVGFGTFDGVSGRADDIEAVVNGDYTAVTEGIGYNYGWTELEFRAVPWLSVIGRAVLGVDRDGLGGGGHFRLRVGEEQGTNLELGAARVGPIGDTYLLRLAWDTVEKVPMAAAVHVTNQPGVARDEFAVRLVYELRYDVSDWMALGGRIGWQLRNIDHAGPSLGVTTVFSW